MRMAFGLFGLLVGIGVVVVAFKYVGGPSLDQSLKARKNAQEKLNPMTGAGQAAARESISLDALNAGGKFDSLLVRDIVAGGAIEQRYGLRKEDAITALNGVGVKDVAMNDADGAKDLFFDNYGRGGTITVIRDGQQITLPRSGGNPSPPSKGPLGPLDGKVKLPGQ